MGDRICHLVIRPVWKCAAESPAARHLLLQLLVLRLEFIAAQFRVENPRDLEQLLALRFLAELKAHAGDGQPRAEPGRASRRVERLQLPIDRLGSLQVGRLPAFHRKSANRFQQLAVALEKRGWKVTKLEKLFGINLLRLYREVWGS